MLISQNYGHLLKVTSVLITLYIIILPLCDILFVQSHQAVC